MLEYAELKKVVNREVSLVVWVGNGLRFTLINSLNAKVTIYKNQSIDLLCKSIDWFLYGRLVS